MNILSTLWTKYRPGKTGQSSCTTHTVLLVAFCCPVAFSNAVSDPVSSNAVTSSQASTPPAHRVIPDFEATYELKKGQLNIGAMTRSLKTLSADSHQFESIMRPNGIARLFFSAPIIERSEWRYAHSAVQPLQYSYSDTADDTVPQKHYVLDWNERKVTDVRSGAAWKSPLVTGTQDNLGYQLQLMLDLHDSASNLTYTVADDGKVRKYTVAVIGPEPVQLAIGTFQTLRVQFIHGKRATTLWCAKELGNLPVRIEQRRGNDTPITATLVSVTGNLDAPQ